MTHANTRARRAGFTLIEVMVAMVIVIMMILLIGNIFQQVSDSWNIGTQSSEANTAGRAAMDLIVRELSHAVAGPIHVAPGTQAVNPDIMFQVIGGNEVYFTTLTGEPNLTDNRRALRGIGFWLNDANNTLRYTRGTSSFDPYNDVAHKDMGPLGGVLLIPHVTDFKIYVYPDANALQTANPDPAYNAGKLPFCVDIYLELLSPDDMLRYQATGFDPGFRERNARRFTARVHFPNRRGYMASGL